MQRFLLLGCLAVGCTGGDDAADKGPTPLHRAFDADRAWEHLVHQVEIGPRHAGSAGGEATRVYLEAELRAAGLDPVREAFTEQTPVGPIEFANVYADLPGSGGEDQPIFVLASHFDTKRLGPDFVGANDAGSSTAVLLELARVIADGPERPVTYRFLFLDGEEAVDERWRDPDNRYGSRHHVKAIKRAGLNRRVALCVLLDMIGDRDLELTYERYSDRDLLALFERVAKQHGLEDLVWGRSLPVLDDHISFSEGLSIPVIDLIDFDYGPRNAWWHTNRDTLDKCSKESLSKIGRLVLHALPMLEERYGG